MCVREPVKWNVPTKGQDSSLKGGEGREEGGRGALCYIDKIDRR